MAASTAEDDTEVRRCGISVYGIVLSAAMIDQLRSRPGTDAIGVTDRDFAKTSSHIALREKD